MAQSLNTKVDLVISGTSYLGMGSYGKIMIGDKAFEFYNERNVEDYIQIPWTEVDKVAASLMLKGKWIARFAVMTKENGNYSFSSKDNKKLLRTLKNYIAAEDIVRSLTFMDVIKRGVKSIMKRG